MAKAKAKKPPRCCFMEGRRRCIRNGTGNPPLCQAHRAFVIAQARREEQEQETPLGGLISDIFEGRPIDTGKVKSVIDDVMSAWGFSRRDVQPQIPHAHARPRAAPRPPPPPVDLDAERRRRALAVLGFASQQVPTKDEVQKRHRELAKKHHPDKGGDPRKMAAINDARDVLLA